MEQDFESIAEIAFGKIEMKEFKYLKIMSTNYETYLKNRVRSDLTKDEKVKEKLHV